MISSTPPDRPPSGSSDSGLRFPERLRVALPALWAGMLLAVALIAAPATFAMLGAADAGRVVGRIFAVEAQASLLLAVVFILLERRYGDAAPFGADLLLALGTLFCTVAGYFVLAPMIAAARAGQGALSFAQLHAASLAFYALKTALVLALAWRLSAANRPSSSGSSGASSRA